MTRREQDAMKRREYLVHDWEYFDNLCGNDTRERASRGADCVSVATATYPSRIISPMGMDERIQGRRIVDSGPTDQERREIIRRTQ